MTLSALVEPIAFVLAIIMVVCNIRQVQWGWPLAILSSALYVWVFATAKLYGDAALQILFIVLAMWGWWQWRKQPVVPAGSTSLLGTSSQTSNQPSNQSNRPRTLQGRQGLWLLALWFVFWLALWFAIDYFLRVFTDSDAPLADAFVTSGSILGTLLLARKFTANWGVWFVVNVASTALFASKQLGLSAVLYALFAVMSVYGWQQWQRDAKAA
jgi:nicotinamide mononucleotide transporter